MLHNACVYCSSHSMFLNVRVCVCIVGANVPRRKHVHIHIYKYMYIHIYKDESLKESKYLDNFLSFFGLLVSDLPREATTRQLVIATS